MSSFIKKVKITFEFDFVVIIVTNYERTTIYYYESLYVLYFLSTSSKLKTNLFKFFDEHISFLSLFIKLVK